MKNVTTYKKQELLDKLLEFEKENSSKEEVVAGNNEGSEHGKTKAARKTTSSTEAENGKAGKPEYSRKPERPNVAENSGSTNNNAVYSNENRSQQRTEQIMLHQYLVIWNNLTAGKCVKVFLKLCRKDMVL